MGTILHSAVAAGSRHAVHNLQYSNATNREAGTNEASGIVLSASNNFQVARQADNDTFWVLTDYSGPTWLRIITGDVSGFGTSNYTTIDILEGGLRVEQSAPILFADNDSFTLPNNSFGFGRFTASAAAAGGATEWGEIAWSSTGTPEFIGNSTNAVLTDTAAKLCFFNDGEVRIKNRLGADKILVYEFTYGLTT